jgi:hypothetical protein
MKQIYILPLIALIALQSALAVDTYDLNIMVNITDYQQKICYYNGTGMPFDCFSIDLNDYNLSNSTAWSNHIEVPVSSANVSCEALADYIKLTVAPNIQVPSNNFTCNPTLSCPSIPNTSCSPALTCPAEDKSVELACVNAFDRQINPPASNGVTSSIDFESMKDWPWAYILIGGLAILLVYLYLKNQKPKSKVTYEQEPEDYDEPEQPVMRRPTPRPAMQRPAYQEVPQYDQEVRRPVQQPNRTLHPELLQALNAVDELAMAPVVPVTPPVPPKPAAPTLTAEEQQKIAKEKRIQELARSISSGKRQ